MSMYDHVPRAMRYAHASDTMAVSDDMSGIAPTRRPSEATWHVQVARPQELGRLPLRWLKTFAHGVLESSASDISRDVAHGDRSALYSGSAARGGAIRPESSCLAEAGWP